MTLSNRSLIGDMQRSGYLKSKNIIKAFEKIDRKNFVLSENIENAYGDYPLPIGYNQTISQPSTVAFMLELLNVGDEDTVLDIGSGSGWTTALIAEIIGKNGKVLGLERISELVQFGNKNLEKYNFTNANIKKSTSEIGTPGKQYNKILVSAMSSTIPDELLEQLTVGGTMVIPVQGSIYKITKISKEKYSTQEFPGFLFVPLIKNNTQ